MWDRGGSWEPSRAALGAVAATLVLAFTYVACGPFGGRGKTVRTAFVRRGAAVRMVSADGTLEALQKVEVAPETSGKVEAVYVKDGETVAAGQTLLQIDDSELRADLADAESVGGGGAPSPTSIKVNTAGLQNALNAQTQVQIQQIQSFRQFVPFLGPLGPLLDQFINLQIAGVQAQTATQAALADVLNQTVSGMAESLSGASSAATQAASEAAEAQAASTARALRRQIAGTTVRAPIGGVVVFGGGTSTASSLSALSQMSGGADVSSLLSLSAPSPGPVRVGSNVSAGSTVMTVYDTAGAQVEATVDETDVTSVAQGQRVDVQIDAFPDADVEGTVSSVSLTPSTSEGGGVTYTVLIDIPVNRLKGWHPGMSATADIIVEQESRALTVPASAVVVRRGRSQVFVLQDGTVRAITVKVREISDNRVRVLSGLRGGEEIVVAGASSLKDGESVKRRD